MTLPLHVEPRVLPACVLGILAMVAACAAAPAVAPAIAPTDAPARALPPGQRVVASRNLRDARLVLVRDDAGAGSLFVIDHDEVFPVPCDRLPNAWGLWLDDVDGDGRAEAIVALHKPARFDPGDHHRLHVYAFDRGRCVPLWRGTRLAGRFDAATVEPERRATLLVHEWTSPARRRIVRYRWTGFGYAVDRILWTGTADPPPELYQRLDHADPSAEGP